MTRKTATLWKHNPAKNADAVTYSSASVTYSSAAVDYVSTTATLDRLGEIASSWSKASKTATTWNPNSAAITNLYPFDSASKVYDSASDTYDGIVTGQNFIDQEKPTVWNET